MKSLADSSSSRIFPFLPLIDGNVFPLRLGFLSLLTALFLLRFLSKLSLLNRKTSTELLNCCLFSLFAADSLVQIEVSARRLSSELSLLPFLALQ